MKAGTANVLTMNALRAAMLVGIVALTACTESFDLTLNYQTKSTPTEALVIDNAAGSVRLRRTGAGGAISGTVKIHASGFDKASQARAAAEQVEIGERINGGELVLTVEIPQAQRNKFFVVTFDLWVPDNLIVSSITDTGRVSINGLTVAEVDTTLGEVALAFTSSPAGKATVVRTSDGLVTLDSHEGDVDIATTNAPLELFSVAGNVRASTTQGDITARLVPPPGGEVFLSTTNAPIDLSVPREFGARLLAVTSAPGAVFISSDLIFRPSNSFPDQAEGTLGNGAGRVDVRTTGADIAIHR